MGKIKNDKKVKRCKIKIKIPKNIKKVIQYLLYRSCTLCFSLTVVALTHKWLNTPIMLLVWTALTATCILYCTFNPRPAGPLDFLPPVGGCLNTPRLSRLLRIVEQYGKRRSKAREKSFRNHFGHFLAQVKIEVTRGQNSKIFQNGF